MRAPSLHIIPCFRRHCVTSQVCTIMTEQSHMPHHYVTATCVPSFPNTQRVCSPQASEETYHGTMRHPQHR